MGVQRTGVTNSHFPSPSPQITPPTTTFKVLLWGLLTYICGEGFIWTEDSLHSSLSIFAMNIPDVSLDPSQSDIL